MREQKSPKGFRKLHINAEVWYYRIRSGGISIISPQRERAFVDMSVFTGWDNDTLERASWKGYWPKIGPSHVKEYIQKYDVFGPDCPGSGQECIPPVAREFKGLQIRRFQKEQLRCPHCGMAPIHPVMWRYPAHKKERHLAQAS